ncbi:MAG: DNA helicase UvrD [Elusimicrobia bacterium]|nr:DNA helicase UvrD [Elusimicrobiota bacterium]
MEFIADLHIHSYLSRACSKDLRPEALHRWCQLKGISVLGTGDFTHPKWIAELREKLVPAEEGLFRLSDGLAGKEDESVPASCRGGVRFMLEGEVSCIYKKNGRVRKAHHLIFAPSFEAAERVSSRLEAIGNIRSDGRPILGLDSKDLLSIVLEAGDGAALVPAHAWTPHFSVFGSQSGFDSLEECFEDLTPRIFAIETGLSSDPPMNWRISALDRLSLISNSDAHSPEKLGREANLFDCPLSYPGILDSLKRTGPGRLVKTLEFFPEEGKYHADGHRDCGVRWSPPETLSHKGLCSACGKPVTVGVLNRVEKLADRTEGTRPKAAAGFEHLVPLKEILGQVLDVGPASGKVGRAYDGLLALFGSELKILRSVAVGDLEAAGHPVLARAIGRMRQGQAEVLAGYDGVYGTITLTGS